MSTVVKDLGAVSAYAYAVEKGYTGTEEEFAELMADYAEVGQRAEDAADSALESKTAAQTAATTATNKATEATTAAQTATTKAGEADQSASQASTSAQTASNKASEASTSASTATEKATEATTAAATATSAATTATTAKDDAVSAKTAAQTAQTGAETAAASVEASAEQIAQNASNITELKSELSEAFPVNSASGTNIVIDDAKDVTLKECVFTLKPIQSGTGTPSIDNNRPISANTSVKLSVKKSEVMNLLDVNSLVLTSDSGDKSLLIAENVTLPAGTYTLQRNQRNAIASSTRNRFLVWEGSKQLFTGDTVDTNAAGIHYFTFTITEQKTLKFYWWIHTPSASVTCDKFMLSNGPSYTDYVPHYVPIDEEIEFASPIYGGIYDIVTGNTEKYQDCATFTGADTETWISSTSGKRYLTYAYQSYIKKNSGSSSKIGLICNIFEEVTPNATYSGTVGVSVDDSGVLAICPTGSAMTEQEFRSFLSANNVTVCFPLASAISMVEDNAEITLFEGKNIISGDGIPLDITYVAQPLNNEYIFTAKNIRKSVIVVDAEGNGDFTNIQDAIVSCTDIDANKALTGIHNTILVMPGIYPRFSMGNGGNTGVPLRSISIIGVDKKTCIIKDDTGLYNYPPAEIRTNGTIKNLTFYATHDNGDSGTILSKDQYAVHIDFGACDTVFENCDFISYSNCAVGMGLAQDMSVVFDNCHFENRGDGTWGMLSNGAFYCHTRKAADITNQNLTLKNCEAICENGNIGALFQVLSSGSSTMFLKLYHNMFWSGSGATATVQQGWNTDTSFGNNISIT